ncbi:MAG: ABC transporter permease [Deltaproteobacteria bacterium]|nr:ABC transporter permease [Deltaproteobacteria bacterium]
MKRVLVRWISLRHLARAPLRTLLVLLGIALGVAMLVATAAVNESVRRAFSESVHRVIGPADLVVSGGEVGVGVELIDALVEVEGVAHVAGVLEVTTQHRSGRSLLVLGVDLLGDRHFLDLPGEGGLDPVDDALELVNDPHGILISDRLASELSLTVGSTLALLTPEGLHDFRVHGLIAAKGPAASFGGQVAVMYIDAAQLSFGREGRVDRIDLAIAPGARLEAVQGRVEACVRGRGEVARPGGRVRRLAAILGPFAAGIQVAGLIALLVGMFIIYNAVSIAVVQRRREIGILRAVGATRGRITRLFVAEAVVLGLVGSTLGLILAQQIAGVALAQVAPTVSLLYLPILPGPPQIGSGLALAGIAVGVVTTVIAAYGPARRAAAIDPAETVRPVKDRLSTRPVPDRVLLWVALGLLAVAGAVASGGSLGLGFLAIGIALGSTALSSPAALIALSAGTRRPAERALGIPGRLAIDNVRCTLERSARTVAALAVAVASSLCAASWGRTLEVSIMSWVNDTIPADLTVTNGSPLPDRANIPLPAEAVEALAAIPGVQLVSPVRIVSHDLGPLRVQLISQPTGPYLRAMAAKGLGMRVIDGDEPILGEELEAAPLVLLSENAARRLSLRAGDRTRIRTPSGEHEIGVRAVIIDYTSDLGMVLLDRRWFSEWWGDVSLDSADLYLAPGADPATVAAEARRRLGGHQGIFVSTSSELRSHIERVVLDSVAILRSTDLVAIIVAILGVIGTMIAAVLDRRREIGVLRAIGATRRQVVTAIAVESGFLGLAAAILGALASVPLGLIFVHVVALDATGWHLDYQFPWLSALMVGGSVVIAAVLAGLFPGRVAARASVKDALVYE